MPLAAPPTSGRETVVVLHGVALGRSWTALLARRLAAEGFDVHNLGYPSRTRPLSELGERWLPETLQALGLDAVPRLHFVTHSMGGLVVRRFLAVHRPANLGRVVMLVPPNHGSPLADRLQHRALFRGLFGCNLAALGTGPAAFCHTLPPTADFELGIIAGCRRLNPLGRLWLHGPNDGTVEVTSTRLEGMTAHVVLPRSHTVILFQRRAAALAAAFLRHGRFG